MLSIPKTETMDDIVRVNQDIRKNVFGWNSHKNNASKGDSSFKMLDDAIRFRIPTMTGM